MTTTNLKRNADGSYRGAYKGQEFTVCKVDVQEQLAPCYVVPTWIARCGTIEHRSTSTRSNAVDGLIHRLDMDAVSVPEIDALLKRWAEEIKAIVPLLGQQDATAVVRLESLRSTLTMFEATTRSQAVNFEEKLAKLRARAKQLGELAGVTPNVRPRDPHPKERADG
jgi:hypothetical protein